MRPSRSEFIALRGLRHHVRRWGATDAPRLFLLHGWMDMSASFQFLVDALRGDWQVIAPDWRGFGLSRWQGRPYWFPDYVADLDALLERYSPGEPARLVGHSMGGNIAALYAGLRPARVLRLANLEGFGLAPSDPGEAPERYRKWLDQLAAEPEMRVHADTAALAARLRRDNPRLDEARALFLAGHLGEAGPDGVTVRADPWHRVVNPVLYRLDEAMACWRQVRAPVLWVVGGESPLLARFAADPAAYAARLACFAELREARIEGAGHMLQHDRPEALAALIEDFLAA